MRTAPTLSALSLLLAIGAGDAPAAQAPTIRIAMRDKLAATQRLLEPIVRMDFGAIAREAEPLARITDAEIASWQTVERRDYVQYASLFLLSVKGLREAAINQSTDAVTLEYTTLISSCIRCHTYVAGAQVAALRR